MFFFSLLLSSNWWRARIDYCSGLRMRFQRFPTKLHFRDLVQLRHFYINLYQINTGATEYSNPSKGTFSIPKCLRKLLWEAKINVVSNGISSLLATIIGHFFCYRKFCFDPKLGSEGHVMETTPIKFVTIIAVPFIRSVRARAVCRDVIGTNILTD